MGGSTQTKNARRTKQMDAVMEAVQARGDHPTADQIYLDARARDEKISRGTVYRNLNKLAEAGDILRVEVPGADRYDRLPHPHTHIMCRTCGKVCNVDIPYDESTDEATSKLTGFSAVSHSSIFVGTCPECQKAEDASTDPS